MSIEIGVGVGVFACLVDDVKELNRLLFMALRKLINVVSIGSLMAFSSILQLILMLGDNTMGRVGLEIRGGVIEVD